MPRANSIEINISDSAAILRHNPMSSVTNYMIHSELESGHDDRTRNAKAQARHRAKRKAYIDELEQTATRLQVALGYTADQVSALPSPELKIQELEQDNARLQKENEELRRLLDLYSRTNVYRIA